MVYFDSVDIYKIKKIFAERLRMARAKKDITQKELAKLLGVSKQSVQNWESVKLRDLPRLETLFEIAEKLKVSLVFLLGEQIKEIPTSEEARKENKQTRDSEYDFYRFVNKEYNLTKYPELICEHFEYMKNNPNKCKEIPEKYGKWNIVKQMDRVGETYNTHLLAKEISDTKYVFDIMYPYTFDIERKVVGYIPVNAGKKQINSPRYGYIGKNECSNIGQVILKIEFDKENPQYCGEVTIKIFDKIKEIASKIIKTKNTYPICQIKENQIEKLNNKIKEINERIISDLSQLIAMVFNSNDIDSKFMIAKDKDIKIVQRECYTKRMHYFVIKENVESNNIFYTYYKKDMIELKERKQY